MGTIYCISVIDTKLMVSIWVYDFHDYVYVLCNRKFMISSSFQTQIDPLNAVHGHGPFQLKFPAWGWLG